MIDHLYQSVEIFLAFKSAIFTFVGDFLKPFGVDVDIVSALAIFLGFLKFKKHQEQESIRSIRSSTIQSVVTSIELRATEISRHFASFDDAARSVFFAMGPLQKAHQNEIMSDSHAADNIRLIRQNLLNLRSSAASLKSVMLSSESTISPMISSFIDFDKSKNEPQVRGAAQAASDIKKHTAAFVSILNKVLTKIDVFDGFYNNYSAQGVVEHNIARLGNLILDSLEPLLNAEKGEFLSQSTASTILPIYSNAIRTLVDERIKQFKY